jgi:hypothetical protein
LVAVAARRWWPFLVALPITLVPIAGKTVRTLVYDARAIGPLAGWLLYAVLPVLLTTGLALWFARSANRRLPAPEFARTALLINTWIYFSLNFALCPLSLAMAGVDSAHAERHHLLRLRNRAHRCQPGGPLTAAGSAR